MTALTSLGLTLKHNLKQHIVLCIKSTHVRWGTVMVVDSNQKHKTAKVEIDISAEVLVKPSSDDIRFERVGSVPILVKSMTAIAHKL